MVFVADALGQWLIEQVTEASRKKLTELILGSEQERELRRAADAAVWATADEISPSGDGSSEQAAMIISEVFRNPVPDASRIGPVMLLEGLQAGIARQLAVLDDAELTGIGQSSADVLGTPGTVLADRLTGHLVREIIVRGSGGGPLTPLASQLNHELTRLQIGGILAWLTREIPNASPRLDSDVTAAGQPLEEVVDPFALEVHRPVHPEGAPPGLPVLPPYVSREHDQDLGQVVRAAARGISGIAVLVGGASTGKTRACWEALASLRDQDPPWRLWHPIDPSRPDAALRELAAIGPRTLVWLNEGQFYLDPAQAELGERVAAGLRELLRDPRRAPVLILATMWPGFWNALTVRTTSGNDQHAQARELLAGHDITVPAAFTATQMGQLAQATDARMALAARLARDGAVIQFLAGAPELLARYRNAPPAAAALISAAMDARRLGMGPEVSQAFLDFATPGYLTDAEWDALSEDWLEQALAYATVQCKGAPGPLTRMRPRPVKPASRNPGDQPGAITADAGPLYRLADYLDEHGRMHRASQIPPAEFWSAAAAHAAPSDKAALAEAAHNRGLYRDATQLYKNAAVAGDRRAARYLGHPPACLSSDPRPAHWAAAHAALDDPLSVSFLLNDLRKTGAHEQVAVLADRAAVGIALDHPHGVGVLLNYLREAGAHEQVAVLADRAAVGAALDHPDGLGDLLNSLREAGAHEQIAALASRAAAHLPLEGTCGVASLLDNLQKMGAHEQVAALLARDPATYATLDNAWDVAHLLDTLGDAGAHGQVTALLTRDPAAHVALQDPSGVGYLLDSLRRRGARWQIAALLARDPVAYVSLEDENSWGYLVRSLEEVGAHEQAAALLARDRVVNAALYRRVVGNVSVQEVGAHEQAAALLARDPTAHVALDNPRAVATVIRNLQEMGAHEQAAALASRLPAAGMFQLFLAQQGHTDQFRFGREIDGTPAAPWGWEDLYL